MQALEAHVFPNLQNHALLYIGVFCDAGCTVHFTNTSIQVKHENKVILEGSREPPELWIIQAAQTTCANVTFTTPFKRKALTFLHASMFSPAMQTWIKVINNSHFNNWPIFTAKEVKAHLSKSMAMAMGHLDQQRKNLHSTKPASTQTKLKTQSRSTTLTHHKKTPVMQVLSMKSNSHTCKKNPTSA
jgi:hypothetical protein